MLDLETKLAFAPFMVEDEMDMGDDMAEEMDGEEMDLDGDEDEDMDDMGDDEVEE